MIFLILISVWLEIIFNFALGKSGYPYFQNFLWVLGSDFLRNICMHTSQSRYQFMANYRSKEPVQYLKENSFSYSKYCKQAEAYVHPP